MLALTRGVLASRPVTPASKSASRGIELRRQAAGVFDRFAFARYPAYPVYDLSVPELGAASGSGSVHIVCADARPDGDYNLSMVYLLRDLGTPLSTTIVQKG